MQVNRIRGQQSLLQAHRVLLRAGFALVSSFAWVFVYEFSLAFSRSTTVAFFITVTVYAISQAVLIVATPLSASHLRNGVRRALVFGSLLAALSFAVLGATLSGYFLSPPGWGVVLFGILIGSYRALYWIPYRLQSATVAKTSNIIFEIIFALLPAFAGITLATVALSPLRLLFGAAFLVASSFAPALFLEDIREPFSWGYVETFRKLFETRYQILALRSVFSGIESATLFVLWPLVVFVIVGGSYLLFGMIMTISLLALLAFRGAYRELLRRAGLHASILVEVVFSVSAWLLRLSAGSPFMIVFADSYSYVSAPSGAPEFLSGQHAADSGSYIDEYTALQEIGMAFGRIMLCAFVGGLLYTVPLSIALAISFVVAALAAGAATALSHMIRLQAY